MNCFDIDHLGTVNEGIEIWMHPEPHVRLAWMIWQKGTAIPIVPGTKIDWDPDYGFGYSQSAGRYKRAVKKGETNWLKQAAAVREDGPLSLASPLPDEEDGIIVRWRIQSGWGGDVSVTPGEGAEILAQDKRRHAKPDTAFMVLDLLAILRPGGSIAMSVTGEDANRPFGEISYIGRGAPPIVKIGKG